MFVTDLNLENYRNYSKGSFSFCEGINVLEGPNAVGKTNLVEAVYFGAFGKSPRTSRDKELIKWDEEYAKISLKAQTKYRGLKISAMISKNGEKRIAVDGVGISKLGEFIGRLSVVFFSPDEIKMIKETPQERRKFMDISLSQQSKSYFYALQRYNKILANRNNVLKDSSFNKQLKDTLPVWNFQLAHEGAEIIERRKEFIEFIRPIVDDCHRRVAGPSSGLMVCYETSVKGENTEEELLKALELNLEKDLRLGYTTVGPHRDDMVVLSENVDLRSFGSQGQQRTASLALKLAETQVIELKTGEKPILILDDVLSELDPQRREHLLKQARVQQTLLTCTDYTEDKSIVSNFIRL